MTNFMPFKGIPRNQHPLANTFRNTLLIPTRDAALILNLHSKRISGRSDEVDEIDLSSFTGSEVVQSF